MTSQALPGNDRLISYSTTPLKLFRLPDRPLTPPKLRAAALCLCLLALAIAPGRRAAAEDPQEHPRTIEDLNLKGAAADNPPFTDTILGADSAFRRALFDRGLLLRMSVNGAYIQNTIAAPVAADAQTYTGQRQFGEYSLNPVLTADLRQLGLHHAQLTINGQIQQATWNPAQPTAFTIDSVYFYKEFGEDRVELKVGYITTDFQFIGLQVGGRSPLERKASTPFCPTRSASPTARFPRPSSRSNTAGKTASTSKQPSSAPASPAQRKPPCTATRSGFVFCPTATSFWASPKGACGTQLLPAASAPGIAPATSPTTLPTPACIPASSRAETTAHTCSPTTSFGSPNPPTQPAASTPAAPPWSSPPISMSIASTMKPASTTPRLSEPAPMISPPS